MDGDKPRYRTRCRVCGIAHQLNDTDPRPGFVAGNISFGPNAFDGYVDEEPVTGYEVYFVDGCGLPMGRAVATVPKRSSGVPQVTGPHGEYCCQSDAYMAEVIEPIPWGSDRLVIVPVTPVGPLTVGELTDIIYDWVINETAGVAVASGGMASALPSFWSLASVTFVAAASLLTSRGQ